MGVIPIGLTGGVAEGKTTVLRILSEMGFRTVSADDVAREVLDDPIVWDLVAERLDLPGSPDRQELRQIIAHDPNKRRVLNSLVHPEVLTRILEARPDAVEIPLLIETCIQSLFKRVWLVTCGLDEQRRRLESRLGDPELASSLIQSQLPFETKRCFADQVIRTDHPLQSVVKSVKEIGRQARL